MNSCEFLSPNGDGYLYCHPPAEPKAQYGSCGDCHCINGDEPCPSDPDEIPLTSVGDDMLRQLKQMDVTEGGYEMICNPYNTTGAIQKGTCTSPAQVEYQLELWETAACGKCGGKSSGICNVSSSTHALLSYHRICRDQVRPEFFGRGAMPYAQYTMKTYDSEAELLADEAEMTHWGAVRALWCLCLRLFALYYS